MVALKLQAPPTLKGDLANALAAVLAAPVPDKGDFTAITRTFDNPDPALYGGEIALRVTPSPVNGDDRCLEIRLKSPTGDGEVSWFAFVGGASAFSALASDARLPERILDGLAEAAHSLRGHDLGCLP
jgi:hypothetical protein